MVLKRFRTENPKIIGSNLHMFLFCSIEGNCTCTFVLLLQRVIQRPSLFSDVAVIMDYFQELVFLC